MPLKRGTPYCINHRTTRLRTPSHATSTSWLSDMLSRLASEESRVTPIEMFICPICGYVETYAHSRVRSSLVIDDSFLPERSGGRSVLAALNFQHSVIDALRRGEPPFANAKVESEVPIDKNDRINHVDAVVELPNKRLFVLEIKAAVSDRIVHATVHAAMDHAKAYSQSAGRLAKPLVIVPETAQVRRALHNVPVVRFDQSTGKFVDDLPDRPRVTAG